jgi:hypothetical protein
MPTLRILNLTSEDVYVGSLYTSVPANSYIDNYRSAADLMNMRDLHALKTAGTVDFTVTYTADEVASGFTPYPGLHAGGTTDFVVGKDPGDPYPTLAAGLAAAGAAASPTRWQDVLVKPFVFDEGTVPFPPYVRLIGSSDYSAELNVAVSQKGQSWLVGGFDMTTPGDRAIYNFSVLRETGDTIPCIRHIMPAGQSGVLRIFNSNLVHDDKYGILDIDVVGGAGSLLSQVWCWRTYLDGTGSDLGNYPLVKVGSPGYFSASSSWLSLWELGAGDVALELNGGGQGNLEFCVVFGLVTLKDTSLLQDVSSQFSSWFGPAVDIAAGAGLRNWMPPYFWGTGANDVAGAGTIFGCGYYMRPGVVLQATLTLSDVGARTTYKPAILGNWAGTDPKRMSAALDRIAAALGPIP